MNYIQSYEKGKTKRKHQIIMEKHLGRPLKNNEVVHHIDGNKRNNDISNLVVVSRSEHAKIHADKLDKSIAVIQCDKSGNEIKKWKSARAACEELGLYPSNVSKCCNGTLKSSGGYIWKFAE
jgi:hypothetical protein